VEKTQKFWQFQMVKNSTTSAELLLYGSIGASWWDEEAVSPKEFAKELKALGNVQEITVRINSNGGDVFAGQTIYSLLKSHQAKITVYIDGLAASIASVIAMVGDTVIMPKNAMLMIHNPWCYSMGNANDFRKLADDLDKIRETSLAVYQEKSNLEKEKIIELLDGETWLTAEEALAYGFIDQIDQIQVAASVQTDVLFMNGQKFDLTQFKKRPQILEASIKNQSEGEEEMTLEELKAKYPELYQVAYGEGVKAEKARFQGLQQLETPGCEEILNKARFETGQNAAEVSMEIVAALKEQMQKGGGGQSKIVALYDDAKHLDQVPPAPMPMDAKSKEVKERNEAAAKMAQAANKKRGVN